MGEEPLLIELQQPLSKPNPDEQDEVCDRDGHWANEFYVILDKAYAYDKDTDVDDFVYQKQRSKFQSLWDKVRSMTWNDFIVLQNCTNAIQFVSFYNSDMNPTVKVSVAIDSHFTAHIKVHRMSLPANHDFWTGLPKWFDTLHEVTRLLDKLSLYSVCTANYEECYTSLVPTGAGVSCGANLPMAAFREPDMGAYDGDILYSSTIRSTNCHYLVRTGIRCKPCQLTRGNLRKRLSVLREQSAKPLPTVSSHKPNASMSKEELVHKVVQMKNESRNLKAVVTRLREKIQHMIDEQGTELCEDDADDMIKIMDSCKPTSFTEAQSLFWQQQLEYNQAKNKRTMRWHPMIIKWCLYLHSRSSKSYENIRKAGFINLPSQRTLYDYSHYLPSDLGFQPQVFADLVGVAEKHNMYADEWRSYVGILLDEMKVKQDLVFDHNSGELIGYLHLDNIGNQFQELERELSKSSSKLANSVLVLMVRGATSRLKYPAAAFATDGVVAEQLYSIVWQTVKVLDRASLQVEDALHYM